MKRKQLSRKTIKVIFSCSYLLLVSITSSCLLCPPSTAHTLLLCICLFFLASCCSALFTCGECMYVCMHVCLNDCSSGSDTLRYTDDFILCFIEERAQSVLFQRVWSWVVCFMEASPGCDSDKKNFHAHFKWSHFFFHFDI